MPLIVKMQILGDIKAEMTTASLARAYDVGVRSIDRLREKKGPSGLSRQRLPAGFELLVQTISI